MFFTLFATYMHMGYVKTCLFNRDDCIWLHTDALGCMQMHMESVFVDFHVFSLVFMDSQRSAARSLMCAAQAPMPAAQALMSAAQALLAAAQAHCFAAQVLMSAAQAQIGCRKGGAAQAQIYFFSYLIIWRRRERM